MRWDFRLVRRMVNGEERLGIHRAFYADPSPPPGTPPDDGEMPQAVSPAPCPVEGDDPADILERMAQALRRPVLRLEDLGEDTLLAGFQAAEEQRLVTGLLRKADGMGLYLSQLKEDAPDPTEWPCEEPPDMEPGSYIAFARKSPNQDFVLEFPDIPDCSAHGHSLEQAQTLARQAMTVRLNDICRQGLPAPAARDWQELSVSPIRRGAALIVLSPYPDGSIP